MTRSITDAEFEELYRTTAPELLAYVKRRGSSDPEALVAEAYAVAWRRRADLPPPLLRRAWLFGAVRRLLLVEARARGREHDTILHSARLDPDPSAGCDGRVAEAVTEALERLRPDEREVILLVEWERLTPAEVAVVLGVRPGTARVRLHRARQRLAADPALTSLARTSTPGSGDHSVPTLGRE